MLRSLAVAALAATLASCRDESISRRADPAAVAATAPIQRPIDPMQALDVMKDLSPSNFQSSRGTCLRTDPDAGSSRLVYLQLPSDTAYLRINVVSGRGSLEMVELVRGVSGGRIWSATLGSALVVHTFASASDHSPLTVQLPSSGPEAQRLRAVASAAVQLPCASQIAG
jgi:hypothetical protein